MTRWMLPCLLTFLLLTSTAMAGKNSINLKDPKQVDAFLLNTLQELVRANVALGKGLLHAERDRNLGSLLHKIRINLNAKAMLRVNKAYDYFLTLLDKKIPTLTPASRKGLRLLVREFKAVAKQARKDTDAGKWSKLKALPPVAAPSLRATKPLTATQRKAALTVIDAFGPSLEILSYYRLLQVAQRKKRAGLVAFLKVVHRAKNNIKVLSMIFSKAAPSLRMMHYHLALTMRCGLLQLRLLKAKGGKKTAYSMRYDRRKQQLSSSLKKANSAFSAFWKSAIDER